MTTSVEIVTTDGLSVGRVLVQHDGEAAPEQIAASARAALTVFVVGGREITAADILEWEA